MKIFDEGIIVSKYDYSDSSLILTIFSSKYGLIKGLYKGAKSSKNKFLLEIGNIVDFEKISRLEEQLGFLKIELKESYLSSIFYDNKKLLTIINMAQLIIEFLVEKEVQHDFYIATKNMIIVLQNNDFLYYYLQWEVMLLQVIGYGLDLSKCCVSGVNNIYYLSPKSAKAVSKEIGDPWADKLFVLPSLWIHKNIKIATLEDLTRGFAISSYFLNKFAIEYNKQIPQIRLKIIKY